MDFFDDLTAAVVRDAAKRGIRCSDSEWQRFLSAVEKAPAVNAPEPEPFRREFAPAAAESFPEPAVQSHSEAAAAPAGEPLVLPHDWAGLQQLALSCGNCQLAARRTNVVFGEGNINARLMFIGEGPGAEEDATGRPFVGAAGQLLDKMIAAMHLSRSEVYIANVVKCRPPGNRMPGEDEAACCIGYLHRQIELIKPKVIVLLGGTALHFLLKVDGITRHRGRWLDFNNIAVMPTFHPAYLLRNPGAKREAWHDLKLVMGKLGIQI